MKPYETEVSSKYGAPMGRPSDATLHGRVFLERVPFVDGDYDPGGAYWGNVEGNPLWCAWNEEGTKFFRAATLEQAKFILKGCEIVESEDPVADLPAFLEGYQTAALWSSNDCSDDTGGEPLDANYSVLDIAPETVEKMRAECLQFLKANAVDVATMHDPAQAGHCFWLDRNGHGTGFWDHAVGKVGDRLEQAAKAFPEVSLSVSDGKIYQD
jgi:hypothetical protein